MGIIKIAKASGSSIQQQLYDQLRTAIIEGRTQAGERLPSTRSLAAQLNIARGTVDLAYARLAEEGYIVARGQRGTIVSPQVQSLLRTRTTRATWVSKHQPGDDYSLRFRLGVPALDLFPRKAWSRVAAREARKVGTASLPYPDPAGLPTLREAITTYLAVARGIACSPNQVVVTAGYQAALNFVAHLVLTPGDSVWLEDPAYGFALEALRSLSMRIFPVPVDEEGIRVGYGRSNCPHAALAVVTPAHQFPLGTTLSLPRRQALLAWASDSDSWILEDDYDCEFYYRGHRPPALKSIDSADRVFYAGSFSKTLFPALRLGYLVVPTRFHDSAKRACRTLHRGAAVLEQSVVTAFMAEGHFARHLRRMRVRYRARRQALADALNKQFGNDVEVILQAGGLHILARFPGHGSDVDLADQALRHGLMPHPLSRQFIEHDPRQGLLMSFTNIPEQESLNIVAALHRAIVR